MYIGCSRSTFGVLANGVFYGANKIPLEALLVPLRVLKVG